MKSFLICTLRYILLRLRFAKYSGRTVCILLIMFLDTIFVWKNYSANGFNNHLSDPILHRTRTNIVSIAARRAAIDKSFVLVLPVISILVPEGQHENFLILVAVMEQIFR